MHIERLIDIGKFSSSLEWKMIESHLVSGSFTLRDEPGKKRNKGSGVKPIKEACMQHLRSLGWALETPIDVATLKRPGPIDATIQVGNRLFCMEWETGNVSSSHRALNKMALGIMRGIFVGGALVLPTRSMYKYLTDRIGNFPEIEPYFPLWRSLQVEEGLLLVIAIEHDAVSSSVPRISKGTDGRALQ
jgi:hypothetical protein